MTRVAHLAETLASLEGVQLVQDRRQYNSAHRHTQEILNWIRQRTAKFHEGKTAPIFTTIIARQGAKTVQRLPALWVTDANNCRCLVTAPAEIRRHTADIFFKQTCYRTSLWGPKHKCEGEELVNELLNPECTEIAQARLLATMPSGLQKQFGHPFPAQEFQCVSDPCCLHDIQEIIQKQSPKKAPGPSGGHFGHLQHLPLSFLEMLVGIYL